MKGIREEEGGGQLLCKSPLEGSHLRHMHSKVHSFCSLAELNRWALVMKLPYPSFNACFTDAKCASENEFDAF